MNDCTYSHWFSYSQAVISSRNNCVVVCRILRMQIGNGKSVVVVTHDKFPQSGSSVVAVARSPLELVLWFLSKMDVKLSIPISNELLAIIDSDPQCYWKSSRIVTCIVASVWADKVIVDIVERESWSESGLECPEVSCLHLVSLSRQMWDILPS